VWVLAKRKRIAESNDCESLEKFGNGEFTEPHRPASALGNSGQWGALAVAKAVLASGRPEASEIAGALRSGSDAALSGSHLWHAHLARGFVLTRTSGPDAALLLGRMPRPLSAV
jgi:hypothetical protein